MASVHTVRQGDCISSIAKEHGFFPETLWNHPDNAALRELRDDGHVLLPGDSVAIPDLREKEQSGACKKRHRFRRKGVPSEVRIQIMKEDEPWALTPFTFEVDGETTKGTTDGEGVVVVAIDPCARRGVLRVGPKDEQQVYEIEFGHLDPSDALSGVQGRLNNLGYPCGETDGVCGERTREALKNFQAAFDLEVTGEPDAATRGKLDELHEG